MILFGKVIALLYPAIFPTQLRLMYECVGCCHVCVYIYMCIMRVERTLAEWTVLVGGQRDISCV